MTLDEIPYQEASVNLTYSLSVKTL